MEKNGKKYIINLDKNNDNKSIQINFRKKKRRNNTDTNYNQQGNNRPRSKNIFLCGFFGWYNITWFLREILKIYTEEKSFFSKKRIESSIGFVIAQCGMICFLYYNFDNLTMSEFMLWAGAEFVVAGYYVNKIQKEKRTQTQEYYSEEDFYEGGDDTEPEDTEGDLPTNL